VPRARLVIGGATVLDHGAYRERYESTLSGLLFATRLCARARVAGRRGSGVFPSRARLVVSVGR
jgi:hypothetical protein